ncbi:Acyl-coenzyme A thioesterase 11 [Podila epigama]|nr:Acyl-coenzyme A thioesterase 11 [Podila epigama]
MEVGVRVMTEDLLTAEQRYCCHAYLTFVALPQPPLTSLVAGPSVMPSQSTAVTPANADVAASKAMLANSPAARRYSFSLPSASKNKGSNANPNQQASQLIHLPAIEPVSPIEMERYIMAQSRREARLQQSTIAKELEDNMLSDIRALMRTWNVTKTLKHRAKTTSPPSTHMDNMPLPKVTMQSTFAESAQLVLPQHANSLSITFGGQVMKWMENVCTVSASRLARVPIVTASMEVYVFVDSENLVTGKQTFTNEAFFSLVALQPSPASHPIRFLSSLPELSPESPLEKALSDSGEHRRARRLEQRRELAEREAALSAHSP